MELLQAINHPAELRRLARARLKPLARALRELLLESAHGQGADLSCSLGTVELTIALHYVFNTPHDRIMWDAADQACCHNILSGCREPVQAQHRKHSSTAISTALGIAHAARIKGEDRHAVAVVSTDAIGAGMVYEALNNAGVRDDLKLLVVLNDNGMPAAGALRRREAAPEAMCEALGARYTGPVDGHELDALVASLEQARKSKGPQVLHVLTQRRSGAPGQRGRPGVLGDAACNSYCEAFENWLCDMAAHDPRLVCVVPRMDERPGLARFGQLFPGRCFDVGLAEQHAVTFAGGLATQGMKPVIAICSTFLQRGYDQLIHDVALQRLDVTFALDRAGLAGAGGPAHAGSFDMVYLRCIPNLVVMAPSSENECRRMLTTAFRHPGPAAVRYPRGPGVAATVERDLTALPMGRGEIRRRGKHVAILAFGAMLAPCVRAAAELDATVADMRFVKPLDTELVKRLAKKHDGLVTVEEGSAMGGAGAAVAEALAREGIQRPLLMLGLPDRFIAQGDPAALPAGAGLDAQGIAASIRQRFGLNEARLDQAAAAG